MILLSYVKYSIYTLKLAKSYLTNAFCREAFELFLLFKCSLSHIKKSYALPIYCLPLRVFTKEWIPPSEARPLNILSYNFIQALLFKSRVKIGLG